MPLNTTPAARPSTAGKPPAPCRTGRAQFPAHLKPGEILLFSLAAIAAGAISGLIVWNILKACWDIDFSEPPAVLSGPAGLPAGDDQAERQGSTVPRFIRVGVTTP